MAPSAFMYYPPPTVTAITPNDGTRVGGTPVTVTGTGFAANDPGETVCTIELKELAEPRRRRRHDPHRHHADVVDETAKDVTVANRNGQATLNGGFRYVGPIPVDLLGHPDRGPTRRRHPPAPSRASSSRSTGGELSVRFGDGEATLVTRIDDRDAHLRHPAQVLAGFVDVTVAQRQRRVVHPADGFYYIPAARADRRHPSEDPIDGGTSVTIIGVSFTGGGTITSVRRDTGDRRGGRRRQHDHVRHARRSGHRPGDGPRAERQRPGHDLGRLHVLPAPSFWWEETFGTASTSLLLPRVHRRLPPGRLPVLRHELDLGLRRQRRAPRLRRPTTTPTAPPTPCSRSPTSRSSAQMH